MSSSTLALTLLLLFPYIYSHLIGPVVVPATFLHRRGIDQSTLLENGKAAQKLNAKFSTLNLTSTCQTGDMACIAGGFSQCVGGKYVGGPCAQGLKCFAMPLLLKKGTTLGCDTEADATSRISNTGATGGLTGSSNSARPSAAPGNNTEASLVPKGVNGTQADLPDLDEGAVSSSGDMSDDGSTGKSPNATGINASTAPANSSDASHSSTPSTEPAQEKSDDADAPSAPVKSPSSCRSSTQNKTTASSASSNHTAQSTPAKGNSTSSADKPKPVAAVLDLDEMNITGP
ncbi:hypothetical protein PCASD_08825 [Puccinia coronata f. sp. avenae]|uniref:Carbohydrate-binding module family 19 domain-containing protein n=2 Tax=Puccinia coronata f. sp. avenae TaxID=200324 RepID=A0A2N5ST56_9BASI|nr:hypothetical protein PCASD_21368 [Puccinia coronata f. sp. avenae]PLW40523.1 hypothetical protein PCASD_08825 [Puccinia coronata f. sp. avenae]